MAPLLKVTEPPEQVVVAFGDAAKVSPAGKALASETLLALAFDFVFVTTIVICETPPAVLGTIAVGENPIETPIPSTLERVA